MMLFVDSEFADTTASELVAIALVSECGEFEFYAERDPLPSAPSDFVRSVVYPLLDRGPYALDDATLTQRLHAFLGRARKASKRGEVLVAYDFPADIHLLDYVLDGFKSPVNPTRPHYKVFNLHLLGESYLPAVQRIFSSNANVAAKRHHALIDAWVNRYAFLAVRGLTSNRSVLDVVSRGNFELQIDP